MGNPNLVEQMRAQIRRTLERKSEEAHERKLAEIRSGSTASSQLQPTFSPIQWEGKDFELAEWLEAAWTKGQLKAKSWQEALEVAAPHFKNRHGGKITAASLAQTLRNKRNRAAGKK